MAVTCSACGYDKNPDGTEFCDACGSEIAGPVIEVTPEPVVPAPVVPNPAPSSPTSNPTVISRQPENTTMTAGTVTAGEEVPVYEPALTTETPAEVYSPPVSPSAPATYVPPSTTAPATNGAIARLIPKQAGAPVPEFVIDNGSAIVGIFDPDTGPVEVDLEGFSGDETVSRNHAEIYQEGASWKVKDLGSTNGVFIKPAGQSRFASRITVPTAINAGDELAIAKVRLLFQTA